MQNTENRHHLKKLTDLYKRMDGIMEARKDFSIHPADLPAPIDFYLFIEDRIFSFANLTLFNARIGTAGYYLGKVVVTHPIFDLVNGTVVLKSYRYMIEIIKKE